MDALLYCGEENWKRFRRASVTCSDIGKILGLDGGCSRRKLLLDKVLDRELQDYCDDYTRKLLALGKSFEPIARKSFLESRFGSEWSWFVPSLHSHRTLEFFCGTPDLLTTDNGGMVTELKTRFWPNAYEAAPFRGVGDVPCKYYLQLQGYLELMDCESGLLYVWSMFRGDSCFTVYRDRELFERLVVPSIVEFNSSLCSAMQAYSQDPACLSSLCYVMPRGEKRRNELVVRSSMISNTKSF